MLRIVVLLISLFFAFSAEVLAFPKDTFVTVSNPVRGPENWENPLIDPLTVPKLEYETSTVSATPISWMLRYDVVNDASMSAYFEKIYATSNKDTLGALLEITPNLAKAAQVEYPRGDSHLSANRVFLSGYYPEKRIKLIDTYMESFKNRFGLLPKSVYASHIDSYSLNYLKEKYSIIVAVLGDSTGGNINAVFNGGYQTSPYLPSKNNSLIPAQSANERIDLVIINSVNSNLLNYFDSLNPQTGAEVIYHKNRISEISQKDFNEFTHINLGIENNSKKIVTRQEVVNSYRNLLDIKKELDLKVVSLETLGNFVINRYPETAPVYFYRFGNTFIYQNPFYKINLISENGQTKITNFYAYNQNFYEDYFSTPNISNIVFQEIPSIVDINKYPESGVVWDIDLTTSKITYDNWRVRFDNGNKTVLLNPREIEFKNLTPEINSKNIKVEKKNDLLLWKVDPQIPYKQGFNHFYLALSIFIPIIICAFIFNKTLSVGLILAFISTLTVVRSGDLYPFGLGIWGPNGHDAIFHISLIQKFASNPLDLSHPQISGEKLSNYHFVFDYLSGLFSRFTGIPADTIYFLVFPVITSILIIYLLNLLLNKWRLNSSERILSYIFVFLAGSLGFIPALLNGSNPLFSESVFWSNQSASIFLNPPFALSLIFLLYFLLLIEKFSKPTVSQLVLIAMVGGILAQTKLYAFILLCLALLFAKKIKLLLSVGITGSLITLPFLSFSGSPFTLSPFWFNRSMFASFDRVWWPKLSQAWSTYESGGSWIKLILVNIFALFVFIVGNLSTRLFALPFLFKKNLSLSQKIALYISIGGIILPLIIIQKVNPWNTIQFIYYSLFFFGIFAGIEVSRMSQKIKSSIARGIFLFVVISLTIFTGVGTIYGYLGYYSSSRISYTELCALEKLSTMPKGIVISPLHSTSKSGSVPTPKPLYSYVSTAYISAYSHQPEYLSDIINLDITNFDYTKKSRQVQRFYQTNNINWAVDFLKKENILYVYETPLTRIKLKPADICLEKIFDSGEINIYKFNCHE